MTSSAFDLKTFPKTRKCNTIRRRALNYLVELGVKEIPLEKAKEQFSEITGLYDRLTLKAYFGTKKHRSKKNIQRIARYGTGTFSFKNIELIQDVETKCGYLEKLGLVHFEQRGKTWFMIVNENAVLVPQLYERKQLSMENISLSPISQKVNGQSPRKESEKTFGCLSINELVTNNNSQNERYKLVDKTVYENKLVETIIAPYLQAKPTEEPDRAKVKFPKQQPIIPEFEPEGEQQ